MRSTGSVEQPIELLSGLSYYSIYLVSFLLVATLELTLHHPPPITLATAHYRLQPAQGRASTTPTSCRARHCNVCVKRTCPNAVDRLG